MDTNNSKPSVETKQDDWRTGLPPNCRPKIVKDIVERLTRYHPFSGIWGLSLEELTKFVAHSEEKAYTVAISQLDYLQRVHSMMVKADSMSQNSFPNSLPPNRSGNNRGPPESGAFHILQPQVHNQGQPLPTPVSANQSQACEQILSQNTPSNMDSAGVQSSASLTSAQPPVSDLSQTSILNVVAHNFKMQNISGVAQSSVGNTIGQGVPSNIFASPQRQVPGRQQVVPQRLEQQPQDFLQYLYQQHSDHKFHGPVQSHMQQKKQQKNLLQTTSQQSSMQISSIMQPSMVQSANLSGIQHICPSSSQQFVLEDQQSFLIQLQQAASIHKQKAVMMQKSLLPAQQQQHLMTQQPNAPNMQQNQLSGQQNNVGDMQQPDQRLLEQKNDLQILQQDHHRQQLIAQNNMRKNNMEDMRHAFLPGLSAILTSQQPASSLDAGQGNAVGSLQETAVGILQQNTVSALQHGSVIKFSMQVGVDIPQPNIPLQANPHMLQHQNLKQQKKQMLLSQQVKPRKTRKKTLQQQKQQHQQLKQQNQQQKQKFNQKAKQLLPTQVHAHQMPHVHQMNDVNEFRNRPRMEVKPGMFQKHISGGQRTPYTHQQRKSEVSFLISSPQSLQSASQKLSQHSFPEADQQNLLPSLTKAGTPLQSANSPFSVLSPSSPLASSLKSGDSKKPVSGLSPLSDAENKGQQQATVTQPPVPSPAIGTSGISASPLLAESTVSDGGTGIHGNAMSTIASGKSSVTEQPLERLIRAVKYMSFQALSASVSDISSVVSMIDKIAGSVSGNGSRASVGENLVAMTNRYLQAINFITRDGMTGTRKMKRSATAMSLNVVSSAGSGSDNFMFNGPDTFELESRATSSVKRPRVEVNNALLEEIREINLQLIDIVVDVIEEDVDPAAAAEGGDGTIVKGSFIAVALSSDLKSLYASAQMSPIQPLRLLVPTDYPSRSPVLLDKLPIDISKEDEDLSVKAKSRFGRSLRNLSEPMSLEEIARIWDVCARAVISEHAQLRGGGSFSSKYGTWENCLSAA